MRKIKFKTEYVPLSDDAINRHKNFDQLMAMYAVMPKPNWFNRFIQKKWTMFGGGLMTGVIVTSLLWYNYQDQDAAQTVSQQTVVTDPSQPEQKNAVAVIVDSIVNREEVQKNAAMAELPAVSLVTDEVKFTSKEVIQGPEKESSILSQQVITESTGNEKSHAAAAVKNENHSVAVANEMAIQEKDSTIFSGVEQENVITETAVAEHEDDPDQTKVESEGIIAQNADSENNLQDNGTVVENKLEDDQVADETLVVIGPPVFQPEESFADQPSDIVENKSTEAITAPIIIPPLASADKPSNKNSEDLKANDEKVFPGKDKENPKVSGKEKSAVDDSSLHGFFGLNLHLFDRDSTRQRQEGEEKKGWFAFLRDTSTSQKDGHSSVADTGNYLQRYAQVSFITPLSSNGIDGYKYMHYVSLNVLQGYNGALKGVEIGGLLNGNKGYVTGVQFAGLGNYAGGRLKGAQFGGLANTGKSVTGAQFAGITNVSGSFVSGFQAAGIVNIAPDSLNGVQAAGILNMLSSEKKARMGQIAGIGNLSLAESKGIQIAGVFNVANKHDGAQIGLINVGKNIKGFQIGLINISDSISGVPIGLISVSGHGIFDVNGWTSDFLTFNGAIRVGTPYVYNIYAYGVSPFNSELPFGFGIGIGGHIPIKRAFLDIDGMVWTMHRSYFSFYGVNMINQLRVMGGFTVNKYLSVFAGPTYNVGVQDSRYDPFHSSSFYENSGTNTTVYMWPGFVAGIRVF